MGTSPRRLRRLIITLLTAAALVVPVASAPTAVANEPGTLDPTFGTDGYVIDPAGDAGRDLVIQPDGKIVVGGDSNLARYNPDGTLDTTFGTGGRVSPTALTIKRLALQNDGKVVAVGSSGADFAIFRFNSDGSPDAGFGTGSGLWTNDLSRQGFFDTAEDVVIQPDGKIVVVGLSYSSALFDASEILVVRFSTAGVPDPDFGGPLCGSCTGTGGSAYPGITSLNLTPLGIDAAFGVDLQGDGKIVIGGTIDHDNLLVARLTGGNSTPANTVGLLDTTYNTTGYRSIPTAGLVDEVWAVAVQPDDRTVFVGEDNTNVVVGRLTSSGALDTSFAGTGTIVTDIGAGTGGGEVGADVLIQPDGKIVVAGRALYLPSLDEWDFATFRYHPDGSPDTSFGGDGLVLTDLPGDWGELGWGVALQTDGKIVVSGGSRNGLGSTLILRFLPVAAPGLLIAEGTTGEDPGVVLRDYPFTAAPTATWPGGQQLFDSELQVTNFANPGVNILRGLDADGQPPFAPGTNPLNAAVAIPMTAQIGGAGGGIITPTLFCKWELPDMDPALPNVPFSQWSDVPNNSWSVAEHVAGVSQNNTPLDEADDFPISLNPWDDDNLRPLVPGAVAPVQDFPCNFGPGALPEYADGATNVIQVRANVADGNAGVVGPGAATVERTIELWAAVGPIDTVNDVYWKVFHPDGSIKTQVHGVGVDGCDFALLGAQSGNPALAPASMWWAANGTGQIANAAITNDGSNGQTGLVGACQQDQLEYWSATFDLSKHQPCGEYKVEVTANNFGAEASLTNFLDVICFHELAVDFTEVAFGQVEAFPQTSYKLGDLFFDPAGNSASPTVKNLGSGGMEIGVEFYTMYEDNTPGPKFIDEFDAKLGITPSQLQEIGSNDAGAIPGLGADGTWLAVDSPDGLGAQNAIAWFGTGDWQTVCSNEVAKLDVSVHPSAQSGSGAFTGGIKIYARADTATDNVNNTLVNVNDVTIGHPNINPDNGGWVPPPNAPAPLYTCNNDNGFWGGYHNVGENLVRNGNGYNGVPFGAAFDDRYYNPANNGTIDLSTEAGSSNQRSIWNQ